MSEGATNNQDALGNDIAQANKGSNANVNTNAPIFNVNINPSGYANQISLTSEQEEKVSVSSTKLPLIWNIPHYRNPFFTGREDVVSRIYNSLTADKTAAITQPQAISGLGGIGKTQTAIEYAYRYSNDYQAVLWVRAEKHETLLADFVTIASLLNLPEKDEQDQDKTIEAVKKWLTQNTHWLLILDNADDLVLVKQFLPPLYRGHILLTTRSQTTGGMARRIEIDKMRLEEGIQFLLRRANFIGSKNSVDENSSADLESAREIVEVMDGLPLALDQAGAYIEECKCSLSDYLDLYQKRRSALLNRRGNLSFDHPEPVNTTWSLSFEKVKLSNSFASDLLHLCCFLAPDSIPEELIIKGASELGPTLQFIADDPFEWNETIRILLSFSLIQRNPDTNTLSIHRLVQEVLKDQMDEETQRLWANRALKAINKAFSIEEPFTQQSEQRYFPHAQNSAKIIEDYEITSNEAVHLLEYTGSYLQQHFQYHQAELLLTLALTIQEKTLGSDHIDLAKRLHQLGWIHHGQGKYKEAERNLIQAITITEKGLGLEDPQLVSHLSTLGDIYLHLNNTSQAEIVLNRALTIYNKHREILQLPSLFDNLGKLYSSLDEYEKSEFFYKRSLAGAESSASQEGTAITFTNLANLYDKQGRYEEAEDYYQRALEIHEKILLGNSIHFAKAMNDLAEHLEQVGNYEQSEQFHKRALAIYEKFLDPNHIDIALTLFLLAGLYDRQEDYEQAKPLLRRAIPITENSPELNKALESNLLDMLGWIYHYERKYKEAEPLLTQALALREETLEPDDQMICTSLYRLGDIYTHLSKYVRAEALLTRAIEIGEKNTQIDGESIGSIYSKLAQVYQAQGRYQNAIPLYRKALHSFEISLGPEHPTVKNVSNQISFCIHRMKSKRKSKK